MKKLTLEQINCLFQFTQKHYVEYYDLQLELVDHLACGIEKQWENDESISFEDALNTEFKKFGIFGFSDIVDKRKIELQKKYNKFLKKIVVQHLKRKEYIGILVLSAIVYFIFTLIDAKITFIVGIILFYSLAIFQFFRLQLMFKNKVKEMGRKFVLTEMIYKNLFSLSAISGFLNLGIQSLLHLNFSFFYLNIVFTIILPISFLLLYVSCYFLPNHSEEILEEMYPEYKLLKE